MLDFESDMDEEEGEVERGSIEGLIELLMDVKVEEPEDPGDAGGPSATSRSRVYGPVIDPSVVKTYDPSYPTDLGRAFRLKGDDRDTLEEEQVEKMLDMNAHEAIMQLCPLYRAAESSQAREQI